MRFVGNAIIIKDEMRKTKTKKNKRYIFSTVLIPTTDGFANANIHLFLPDKFKGKNINISLVIESASKEIEEEVY